MFLAGGSSGQGLVADEQEATVDAATVEDFADMEIISSSKEEQRTALKRFIFFSRLALAKVFISVGSGRLLRLRQPSLGSQLKLQHTEKGNENKKLDLCYDCVCKKYRN